MTDWARHNEEIRQVWEAYRQGNPIRVPILFAVNPRVLLLDPAYNPEGVTFAQYLFDPEVMIRVQLAFQEWRRTYLPVDWEMGLPQAWDPLYVDGQNVFEQAWFGAPIICGEDGGMPWFEPIFQAKESLDDWGVDTPLSGHFPHLLDTYLHLKERTPQLEYKGRPVGSPPYSGMLGTDGPFTLACSLRGATQLCLDLYEDPCFVHRLMETITQATIQRIKAWLGFLGLSPQPTWSFADDSIELLSPQQYREFVLPYHKRLVQSFSSGQGNSIHLCGRAQQHFLAIHQELGVRVFGTGYPTDLARARQELGPEVELQGNIHPLLLKEGPPEAIRAAVQSLLTSGVMEGGRFILMDGHNLAPETPIENLLSMLEAGKTYGVYR